MKKNCHNCKHCKTETEQNYCFPRVDEGQLIMLALTLIKKTCGSVYMERAIHSLSGKQLMLLARAITAV